MRLCSGGWFWGLILMTGVPSGLLSQSLGRLSSVPDRGTSETEFTVRVEAIDAIRYDLDFGDGSVELGIVPASVGSEVIRRHRFSLGGRYRVTARIFLASGEQMELAVLVTVDGPRPPPPPAPAPPPEPPRVEPDAPVAAAEVPRAAPPQEPPPPVPAAPPPPSRMWPIVGAAVALLGLAGLAWWFLVPLFLAAWLGSPLQFKSKVDPGEARVVGAEEGEAVIMRLQRAESGSQLQARVAKPEDLVAEGTIRLRITRDGGRQKINVAAEGEQV